MPRRDAGTGAPFNLTKKYYDSIISCIFVFTMRYQGTKKRIAKEILPIILKNRKPGQLYFEPFVGGCNSIDKVPGRRAANDLHPELVAMFKALQNGWMPPELITEAEYADMKLHPEFYPPELLGYAGFSLSFGGKWFGGYAREKAGTKGCRDNMALQNKWAFNTITKQAPLLKGVHFSCGSYAEALITEPAVIYCDPPYSGTTGYKGGFNPEEFWQWCRGMKQIGHDVFISEYSAPEDFTTVWTKECNSNLNGKAAKRSTEKLFKP